MKNRTLLTITPNQGAKQGGVYPTDYQIYWHLGNLVVFNIAWKTKTNKMGFTFIKRDKYGK